MSSHAHPIARSIAGSLRLRLVTNRDDRATKDTINKAQAAHPYRCLCGDPLVLCRVHALRDLLPEAHH